MDQIESRGGKHAVKYDKIKKNKYQIKLDPMSTPTSLQARYISTTNDPKDKVHRLGPETLSAEASRSSCEHLARSSAHEDDLDRQVVPDELLQACMRHASLGQS